MFPKIREDVSGVPRIGMWAFSAAVLSSSITGRSVETTKHGVCGVHILLMYSRRLSAGTSLAKEVSVIPSS